MKNMNKLEILDLCVDGDVNKLKQLVGPDYEHYDKFFKLCREHVAVQDVESVSFQQTDVGASFEIHCNNKDKNLHTVLSSLSSDEIEVVNTDTGVNVNISLKE